MGAQGARPRRSWAERAGWVEHPQLVVITGAAMVIGQLVFRAWALYPSWFYLDDYGLLLEAQDQSPTLGYAMTPWNGHLMPGGRWIASLVSASGTLNWELAATITLLIQLLASIACLWMLVTLFGNRWAVLAPFALYLTTAMTVPATMWWTACLSQLAIQLGFFLAVGCWVRYLRDDGARWLLAAYGAVALGLLFDVKALLILPVLVFVALAYFAEGSAWARIKHVVVRRRLAAVVGLPPVLAYVAYYVHAVDEPFVSPSLALVGELTDTMVGTAFASALAGGPWSWSPLAPPNSFADPPGWTVHVAWVLVSLTVLHGLLRRERTGRAWGLLVGYLAVLVALLAVSRAPVYGDVIGLEYRYLTDAACVVALCLGLAFLDLRGAQQPSRPRPEPLLRAPLPPWVTVGLVAVVSVSGLISSARHVHIWHTENVSDAYVHRLQAELRTYGAVDLADQAVPEDVVPAEFTPDNQVRRIVELVSDRASFPESSPALAVVAPDGSVRKALIDTGVTSRPGPESGCGWRVDEDGLRVPLTGRAFPWQWWIRIGYLSSTDSPVVVSAGDTVLETQVQAGLNSLFARVDGSFDAIRLTGLDAGATLCVDIIEVGQPEPGGTLE
ncbi:hypothetical protein NPS01_08810 [Nocardioides psychrotolerans]|uniref:4-amino-4-deoxy-L-arabinose transferase n=1 Tax=Nocardioides psychrotolerans TaxID=1005945 RepID=A0A1I3FML6_9ACTN|nr:hypothetical protein [Nocardioides psychrotolerans]GEP37218.1 hypothetical protein NPS01_08810 [Nocardioides psychrotolerans]SFI12508.1 hypothetical protein SAMN05216561_10561 [Nocardioides psychrotolerans]